MKLRFWFSRIKGLVEQIPEQEVVSLCHQADMWREEQGRDLSMGPEITQNILGTKSATLRKGFGMAISPISDVEGHILQRVEGQGCNELVCLWPRSGMIMLLVFGFFSLREKKSKIVAPPTPAVHTRMLAKSAKPHLP